MCVCVLLRQKYHFVNLAIILFWWTRWKEWLVWMCCVYTICDTIYHKNCAAIQSAYFHTRSNPLIFQRSTTLKVSNWARKCNWFDIKVTIKELLCAVNERVCVYVSVRYASSLIQSIQLSASNSGAIIIFFSSFHNNLKLLEQK